MSTGFRVEASTVTAVRRDGLTVQWGVIIEVSDDLGVGADRPIWRPKPPIIGLWGPAVLEVLAQVGGLPRVERDSRRLFWALKTH